jgi:hypothetical protein
MYWVVQDKMRETGGDRTLRDLLRRLGIPHSYHDVVPIIGELRPDVNPEGNVIVIGSYSMRHAAKAKGWVPGCFDVGHITHDDYVAQWGSALLNASARVCRFEDAPKYIMDEFFVRPTIDSKAFTGQPYNRAEFMSWYEKVMALNDPGAFILPTTEIIIAPIKDITQEYRCWIVDGRVVTSSLYKRGEDQHQVLMDGRVDERIIEYANRFAAGAWQPTRAYVLDLCLSSDELRVLEVNTLNSSGFYAADMAKLVQALEAMEF